MIQSVIPDCCLPRPLQNRQNPLIISSTRKLICTSIFYTASGIGRKSQMMNDSLLYTSDLKWQLYKHTGISSFSRKNKSYWTAWFLTFCWSHRIIGWKRLLRSSSPTVNPTLPCLLKPNPPFSLHGQNRLCQH